MSARGAGAVVAGLVLVIGLVLGLVPHSLAGDGVVGPITCGSAFSPDHASAAGTDLGSAAAGVTTTFEQQCSDALGTPRVVALSLMGVSLLALLFLGMVSMPRAASAPARTEEVSRDQAI